MTSPDTNPLVDAILDLPRRPAETSEVDVIREIEAALRQHPPTIDALARRLAAEPERIDEWIRHSEDKRCSESWFVQREGDGIVLGFVDADHGVRALRRFADPAEGIATFIRHEIDQILSILDSQGRSGRL